MEGEKSHLYKFPESESLSAVLAQWIIYCATKHNIRVEHPVRSPLTVEVKNGKINLRKIYKQ